MPRGDIHQKHDFFAYVPAADSTPGPDPRLIDVALLDMHHGWPNVGHDSLVHAVLEAAEEARALLREAELKVRVISFDVRRRIALPEGGRFSIYLGSGGPGDLDPRHNDGVSLFSQGIRETDAWEAPLFRLFDAILARPDAALIAVCHSFGLLCRWAGVARPVLRQQKSSGVPVNLLSDSAMRHPWFSQFAARLPDGRHFRVIDNRLFDLIADDTRGAQCLAFENGSSAALTMVELARDGDGIMPRMLGMNHHPEIIDRDHVLTVLEEKRAHHDVTESWVQERVTTMRDLLQGETDRQSRLTSEYTLLAPLRHHVRRAIAERLEKNGSAFPEALQRAIQ